MYKIKPSKDRRCSNIHVKCLLEVKVKIIILTLKIKMEISIFPPPNLHSRRYENALPGLIVAEMSLRNLFDVH